MKTKNQNQKSKPKIKSKNQNQKLKPKIKSKNQNQKSKAKIKTKNGLHTALSNEYRSAENKQSCYLTIQQKYSNKNKMKFR